MTAVLEVSRLRKAFGGIRAVDDVSFAIDAGMLVALIGPNGAGKTTCFNCINGQLAPDEGTVTLGSARIDGLAPFVIARQGVGRTFQVAATFASMTVRENAVVALRAHGLPPGDADALLARVGCADIADAHCAALAYGDAKRLELALALAGKPRLLLMDEPTAGMSPSSRARLMQVASDLARHDRIAVLFTEHDMDVVFAFADRVIVLDHGKILADTTPARLVADSGAASIEEAFLSMTGPEGEPA